jgi:hypothetical protein
VLDWLLSVIWYSSILTIFIGLLAVVRPLRWLRLGTRRRAAMLIAVAIALILANACIVPPTRQSGRQETLLDREMPAFQFRETHERLVNASASRVRAAIKEVTAGEIALFQAFTAIRRFGQKGPESLLNAPENLPILDVATRSGFFVLADTDREIVVGSVVAAPRGAPRPRLADLNAQWFRQLSHPGVAKATLNFLVEPIDSEHSRLRTETRVFSSSTQTVRQFTPYWRTIFPGSWILRVTWLNAIAARAER